MEVLNESGMCDTEYVDYVLGSDVKALFYP